MLSTKKIDIQALIVNNPNVDVKLLQDLARLMPKSEQLGGEPASQYGLKRALDDRLSDLVGQQQRSKGETLYCLRAKVGS